MSLGAQLALRYAYYHVILSNNQWRLGLGPTILDGRPSRAAGQKRATPDTRRIFTSWNLSFTSWNLSLMQEFFKVDASRNQ